MFSFGTYLFVLSSLLATFTNILASSSQDFGVIIIPDSLTYGYDNQINSLNAYFSNSSVNVYTRVLEINRIYPTKNLIEKLITNTLLRMKSELHFNYTQDTPLFLAGHGRGGMLVQSYVFGGTPTNLPVKLSGVILEASYVNRVNYDRVAAAKNISILTIAGELDGVNRITRMAESFLFDIKDIDHRITVIVPGMNYFQFSGEGEPMDTVKKYDLKPEITDTFAIAHFTKIVSCFILNVLDLFTKDCQQTLDYSLMLSSDLIAPIIEAFALEGYKFMFPEAKASKWVERAQKIIGTDKVSMIITDGFHSASSFMPDYLPAIKNKCTNNNTCTLNITTVTEPVYHKMNEKNDKAFMPMAAVDMKSKMTSRQCILEAATGQKWDFNRTDGGNLCRDVNQAALEWALKNASPSTLKRYLGRGKKLIIGQDKDLSKFGPLWLWYPLTFTDVTDSNTRKVFTEVISPMMRNPSDYFVHSIACIHFCKILSPARAIEWIYVDSLRS